LKQPVFPNFIEAARAKVLRYYLLYLLKRIVNTDTPKWQLNTVGKIKKEKLTTYQEEIIRISNTFDEIQSQLEIEKQYKRNVSLRYVQMKQKQYLDIKYSILNIERNQELKEFVFEQIYAYFLMQYIQNADTFLGNNSPEEKKVAIQNLASMIQVILKKMDEEVYAEECRILRDRQEKIHYITKSITESYMDDLAIYKNSIKNQKREVEEMLCEVQ
jgi:hypothetical protein